MKKLLVFLGSMCLTLPFADAQPALTTGPLSKHFWLNPESVNYTLSPPTSKGEWIVAAARTERRDGTITSKNTIAVFRLNNEYEILPNIGDCAEDVSVIGLRRSGAGANDTVFDQNVDFEVHSVVQSCNPDAYYIICGSVRRGTGQMQTTGMVVVLDSVLNPKSIRLYDSVQTFYSVYAQDDYYYVCGQMKNGKGIVVQDNITTVNTLSIAWITLSKWVFHEIKVRQRPCSEDYYEFSVSGCGYDIYENIKLGFCIIEMPHSPFWNATLVTDRQFTPSYPIDPNSKVTIGNYPGLGGDARGLILSASSGQEIHTYLLYRNFSPPVDPYPTMQSAFRIFPWNNGEFRLEDMDCGQSPPSIAWVGNWMHPDDMALQRATYIYMSPFLTPPTVIEFTPYYPHQSAYYSLHKIHYYKDQPNPDYLFHAGGYHQYFNNDDIQHSGYRTTFVVTPEPLSPIDRGCAHQVEKKVEEFIPHNVEPLAIWSDGTQVDTVAYLGKRYEFCTMNCEGEKDEDCGNRLLVVTKKRRK